MPNTPLFSLQSRLLSVALVSVSLSLLSACSGSPDEAGAGAAGQGGEQGAQAQMPAPTVGVITTTISNVPQTLELSGRVSAYQTAQVRPQINGIIKKRYFSDGSYVNKGQPLYKVDASDYQSNARALQATLNRNQVNLKSQQTKLARYAKLLKVGAVSQQEYDDIKAQVDLARADIASAKANLKNTELSLGRTVVRAPISGKTERTTVDVGTLVSANQAQALVSISRLDPVYVDMSQSSTEYLKLKQQQVNTGQIMSGDDAQVRLVLKDGSEYGSIGTLTQSDTQVDPATGTVNLRAVFENSQRLLLPGMYVTAKITLAQYTPSMLVPQSAVLRNPQGGADVYVVNADNKVVMQAVKTDGVYQGQWKIIQGLNEGDKVIVSGGMKVQPDMKVNPQIQLTSNTTQMAQKKLDSQQADNQQDTAPTAKSSATNETATAADY